ncbi:MAG: hypothetical protein K2X38_14100 [Gemmataceae bacterium]|nr:hypothetical protein [Gemmataceae bacterium]
MPPPNDAKRVAAIVTEYRRHSHADVIVGKILEGFNHQNRDYPRLRLVSLFCDQFPQRDMARALAKQHGFRLVDRIEDSLTLGGNEVAVDGVLCIGEHGNYPDNDRGQKLYPRRRFFEAATDVMARLKKPAPIFNDKHLSTNWRDAKWMVDRARELRAPFMAGSSIPVTWRRPDLQLPKDCEITEIVQVGYGPFEGYGFHALEGMQCMAERRKGGETGVRSVQCLQGQAMWDAMDRGIFSRTLLEAAMGRVPAHARDDYRKLTASARDAGLFLIEYRDGLKAALAMLNGWAHEGDGGAFTFACSIKGEERPRSCLFYLQQPDPFGHFAHQLRGIESMILTGRPAYPVERTLLTTGILEAVMISVAEKQRRVETPQLEVRYEPTDWAHATGDPPAVIKR